MYRLKTPSHQIALVLSALAEGLDASAAERVFGYRQATITRWVTRVGEHAVSLHERSFRTLWLPHVQVDELRTRLRCASAVLWLWLAIDPLTKVLPDLQLGPRTQQMAHCFIHSLRERLAPDCLPLFTSDGLNLYFYALTAHFGRWLLLGGRGRRLSSPQPSSRTSNGGERIIISCARMLHCERRSGSPAHEGGTGWRNAIGSGRPRWLREEPLDAGQRKKCSRIRCRPSRALRDERP